MEVQFEPEVSLEIVSLFIRGRGKAVYILPSSSGLTLALLLVGFTEYVDDIDEVPLSMLMQRLEKKVKIIDFSADSITFLLA
ncbi:hypothetical protein Hanom_Chr16g01465931 [Helianthus anomalus]